ncbi:GNAT family N-acetyltransferase [Paenibacillus sp. TRM 82003]|nr:GNAT family N-acetyltransferase [Paenibacillus sp. TRM 82003]
MTDIRKLEEREYEAALALSEFAFQFELSADDKAERLEAMKRHDQFGAFADGELAAKYTLIDLETWIHGKRFAMGGIAGVATWPERRRQGLVAKLLGHSLQTMRSRGQSVSFLHPFDFGFYRKFGWETYIEYKSYELRRDQLPPAAPPTGAVNRIAKDDPALDAVYERYASRYNGTLVRPGWWWRDRIFRWEKGQVALYTSAAGIPSGYVFYRVAERTLTVHELVALDEEARLALWGFLRNHDSMIDKATLHAPSDDALSFHLPDPRVKQELVPYFMARLVDAPAFVASYPFVAGGAEANVRLRVHDAYAGWNDGVFALTVDEAGRGALTPESGDAADLDIGIGALAAMMLGYKRPAYLYAAGLLRGAEDAAAALERVLPTRTTYLMDFF